VYADSLSWFVFFLPSYWRFVQCLRRYHRLQCFATAFEAVGNSAVLFTRIRYYDAPGSWNPNLLNAGKYFSSALVTLFSLLAKRDTRFLNAWISFAVIGTLYAYIWDIKKDWGFLSAGANQNCV